MSAAEHQTKLSARLHHVARESGFSLSCSLCMCARAFDRAVEDHERGAISERGLRAAWMRAVHALQTQTGEVWEGTIEESK